MPSRMRPFVLFAVVAITHDCFAAHPVVTSVEFVVGDWLKSEGGDATKDDFPLNRPFGTDFDSKGNMYVVELEGGRVHRIDKSGAVQTISGDGSKSYQGDGGSIAEATYNGMHNLAIDDRDFAYIADSWNHCVRRIDLSQETITTIAGNGQPGFKGDGGPALEAQFDYLMCISLDPQQQSLFAADLKNCRIRKLNLETGVISTVAGNGQHGVPKNGSVAVDSPLVDPRAVAVDSRQRIYILERNGNALRRVDPDGRIITVAGTGEKGFRDGTALQAQFGSPKHICIDSHDRVIIADDANAAIRCYDPDTETVSTLLGRGFGEQRIKLNQPHGVTFQHDQLIVCDTSHNRILRLRLSESN